MPIDLEAENRRLRVQVEELQEAERQRKDALHLAQMMLPQEWHLTRSERLVLLAMMENGSHIATREHLVLVLRNNGFRIHDVNPHICSMRAKLRDFNVVILTVRDVGYQLRKDSAEIVSAAIASKIGDQVDRIQLATKTYVREKNALDR